VHAGGPGPAQAKPDRGLDTTARTGDWTLRRSQETAMPQPEGQELERVRARRAELREKYLKPAADRPKSTVQGVHHLALICRDAEETIKFYQEFLGFPLVELVENRDYAGSNHFFFDIGNKNLLGFFDFPGHEHPAWTETIGGVQHLAISISPEQYDAAKKRLDEAGVDYLGPDRGVEESMYFRDPNGVGLELYREELGVFDGRELLG
jgi:glyoxylase I family protein